MTSLRVLELFFYCCVNLLPGLTLAIITCQDFLRFSLKTTIIISVGVLLCYFIGVLGYDMGIFSYLAVNLFLNTAYVAFGILLTKGKPYELLFALGMILNYGSVCAITSAGIFYVFPYIGDDLGWWCSLITLLVATIFWILYNWLMMKNLRPLFKKTDNDNAWRILWLVPMLFCIIHYFSIWTHEGNFATRSINVIFLMIVNLGAAFVSYLVAYIIDARENALQLENENQRLAMQTAQYQSLRDHIEETRRAKHDLRQHLHLISSYLEHGRDQDLKEYIDRYGESLHLDSNKRYCENEVANTVVQFYAEQAEAVGIEVVFNLQIPQQISISEPDLCILIGNLLENAVNACKKNLDKSPVIRMNTKLMGSRSFIVTLDNYPSQQPKEKNGRLLSSSRNNIGIGTESIRSIANHYSGQVKFEWKNNTFYSAVILTI